MQVQSHECLPSAATIEQAPPWTCQGPDIPTGARPSGMSNICTHKHLAVSISSRLVYRVGAVVQVLCVTLLVQHGQEELPGLLPSCKMLHVTVCSHREKTGPAPQSWTPWKDFCKLPWTWISLIQVLLVFKHNALPIALPITKIYHAIFHWDLCDLKSTCLAKDLLDSEVTYLLIISSACRVTLPPTVQLWAVLSEPQACLGTALAQVLLQFSISMGFR